MSCDDKSRRSGFACSERGLVKFIRHLATITLAAFILLVPGCSLVPPGTGNPLGYRGELVSRVFRRVNLLANPRFLGADYSVPQGRVRQIFAWGSFGSEWRIFVPPDQAYRVGFKFSRPLDFTEPYQNGGGIVFLLYPRALAARLELRLLSDELADMPARKVRGHGIWLHGQWGAYRIPLAELLPKSAAGAEGDFTGRAALPKITGVELVCKEDSAGINGRWLVIRNLEVGGVVHSRRLYEPAPGRSR